MSDRSFLNSSLLNLWLSSKFGHLVMKSFDESPKVLKIDCGYLAFLKLDYQNMS